MKHLPGYRTIINDCFGIQTRLLSDRNHLGAWVMGNETDRLVSPPRGRPHGILHLNLALLYITFADPPLGHSTLTDAIFGSNVNEMTYSSKLLALSNGHALNVRCPCRSRPLVRGAPALWGMLNLFVWMHIRHAPGDVGYR
jgi:hypothetical protein